MCIKKKMDSRRKNVSEKNKRRAFEKHLEMLAPCKIEAEAKISIQALITMYIKEAVTKSAEYAKGCNKDCIDQECFLAVKESVVIQNKKK